MVVDIWPGIFSGKNLGEPGWKDIIVECLHCTNGEGKTAIGKIIAFNLDLCLILISVCLIRDRL